MRKPPKYSRHRASGHAKVRINGKDHYLGEYGSDESKRLYDELLPDGCALVGSLILSM